jgi:hypothetical protein
MLAGVPWQIITAKLKSTSCHKALPGLNDNHRRRYHHAGAFNARD